MALIECRQLSKVYQVGQGEPLRALDSVDLEIESGEYVSIVGPSGSGKSTLLQILGLLDRPSSGSYRLMNADTAMLDDEAVTDLRARSVGFIFQLFNLLPRVNVEENILLPTIYRGVEPGVGWLNEVLQKLGLETHRRHTPSQLSGGQQQRVAIGRALINRPEIILADEPTGNLPQEQAREIISELEKLHAEGITLIVITHDPTIAERASRIIRIVDGRIVSDQPKNGNARPSAREGIVLDFRSSRWNLKLWTNTLKLASQSLARNKVRTFLTTLGIIIGVFSVISMLAIGEGAKKDMEFSLRQMGSNMFRISSSRPSPKGAGVQKAKYYPLSWKNFEALQELQREGSAVRSVAPVVQGTVTVTQGGKDWSTLAEGVDVQYEEMRNNAPVVGRFFTAQEDAAQENVCIMGQTVYQNLFDSGSNPVGKTIKLNLKTFRVIGVLPAKGSGWGRDEDDVILIPIRTAMKKLFGIKNLSSLFVQAASEKDLDRAIEQVTLRLRREHLIQGHEESDFVVKNFGELKQTLEEIRRTMAKFIAIIALISLIVGGIGIMNIMLVSVTERTREIGVRKAIGARRLDILNQFLIESMLIGLVGGVLGVILALVACVIMTNIMNWEVTVRLSFVVGSFVFSLLVGLFFGLYPAYKASKLSPINALRYE